jgi:anti-sigma factor RsiW
MTYLDCKLCRENIPAYVRAHLDREEKKEFEAHLAECLECRREVEQEQKLTAILNGWEVARTSRAFDEDLARRLSQERTRNSSNWFKRLFGYN